MSELAKFVSSCRKLGADASLVQGTGGNISLKLDEERMAIKASGFRLTDVSEESGFVYYDYKKRVQYPPHILRPSIETAFHTFLGKAVVHTHPLAINAITCAQEGEKIAREAFAGEKFAWVPYAAPGEMLAKEIFSRGRSFPSILLENHGLIVHGESPGFCVKETLRLNEMAKKYLRGKGVSVEYPDKQKIEERTGAFISKNSLALLASNDANLASALKKGFLFPDAAVFCAGKLGKISFLKGEGILYSLPKKEAILTDEMLRASIYLLRAIGKIGKPKFLSKEEVAQLLGMEEEKYRQGKAGC